MSHLALRVRDGPYLSASYQFRRGIRQGCPLSPYLFVIVLSVLFDDLYFEYRSPGLLDVRFQTVLKVCFRAVWEVRFRTISATCFRTVSATCFRTVSGVWFWTALGGLFAPCNPSKNDAPKPSKTSPLQPYKSGPPNRPKPTKNQTPPEHTRLPAQTSGYYEG